MERFPPSQGLRRTGRIFPSGPGGILHSAFSQSTRSVARRIRCTQDCGFFCRAHSQIRITRQPVWRRVRVTSLSRILLARSLRRQKARLFFGRVACLGHPCQKHPSTKTAVCDLRKTKSGRTANLRPPPFRHTLFILRSAFCNLPLISRCRRQPVMPCRRNNFASASSVSLLPRLRIRDIRSDLCFLVRKSAMTLDEPNIRWSGIAHTVFHSQQESRHILAINTIPFIANETDGGFINPKSS